MKGDQLQGSRGEGAERGAPAAGRNISNMNVVELFLDFFPNCFEFLPGHNISNMNVVGLPEPFGPPLSRPPSASHLHSSRTSLQDNPRSDFDFV